MSAVRVLFRRELALAWGGGGGPLLACGFFACLTAILPLAAGGDPSVLTPVASGVAWLALALSSLLSLERLFERDLEDGALDLLATGPLPLEAVFAIKATSQWLATGLPLALTAPVAAPAPSTADAAPAVVAAAPVAPPSAPSNAAAVVAAAAPPTDAAEPAAVQATAVQAAAPEVVSVTGKVAQAVEPTAANVTSAATEVAAVAEPVHDPLAAPAHAATTGEGAAGEGFTGGGAQDQAGAQGAAVTDAAPAAPADASAPTFNAPGTAAAPAPVVAAQLPKAGPETVSRLTTEIASKAVVGKTSRFDVVLQPEGLGRVDVRIEIAKDGKLTAALNFDNPAAAAELRGKSGELRQALAAAGFNVADSALSFGSSSQNGGQNNNAFFNFQDGENGRQAFQGRAFRSALGDEIPTLSPSVLLPGLRVADSSGVDVRI